MKTALKWVGSKRLFVDKIVDGVDCDYVIEPFVGSGAVTTYLGLPATWSDVNDDLINFYRHLRDSGNNFIRMCSDYFKPKYNTKEAYLTLRDVFNKTSRGTIKRAVLFYYLNKHSYRGMVRYNKDGEFNTSYGFYKSPTICERTLNGTHRLLQNVDLYCQNFEETLSTPREGAFVFCDPPYPDEMLTGASRSYYTAQNFTFEDQKRLAELLQGPVKEWAGAIRVTNRHDERITDLYKGCEVVPLNMRSNMSLKKENRTSAYPQCMIIVK